MDGQETTEEEKLTFLELSMKNHILFYFLVKSIKDLVWKFTNWIKFVLNLQFFLKLKKLKVT